MSPLSKVVVVGASKAGLSHLGYHIVEALKTDPEFEISVVSRKSSTAEIPEGVNVIKVDDGYPPEELEKAFAGQDAVVMANGFQLIGQEGKFIEAAIKAGVKRFIPSEFGSNTANDKTIAIFPMIGVKAKLAAEIRAKESTGLTWTAICPGMLTDVVLPTGFLGIDIKEHKGTVIDDGNHKFSTTTRANVGKAVLGVLRNPDVTENKYVYVSSFEVSFNEIIAALEKAQGLKYSLLHTTTEDVTAAGKDAMASGNIMAAAKLLLVATMNPGYGNNFTEEVELWNSKIGMPREDLDQVIAGIVQG
ncbi:NmrA-like family protein [Xylariomycetidae sp. FL2044]|nr:NmrA-like family protein [Xylariomycetidae sp. FL2044]